MPRVSAAAETDSSIWRLSLFFLSSFFGGWGRGGVGSRSKLVVLKAGEQQQKRERKKNPNVSLRLAKRTTSRLNKKRF